MPSNFDIVTSYVDKGWIPESENGQFITLKKRPSLWWLLLFPPKLFFTKRITLLRDNNE